MALSPLLCGCALFNAKQARAPRSPAAYLQLARVDTLPFPPAPRPGSEVDKADFAALREWQNKRTDEQCVRAQLQKNGYYEEFFGDISPFTRPLPAEASDFFKRVYEDSFAAFTVIKNRYKRPRPFSVDPAINPCLCTVKLTPYGYPSGHAVMARTFALILSDLVPERREEFMARAEECGLNRVIGGVHHVSDVKAGQLLAEALYPQFLENRAFRADIESMRGYLAQYPVIPVRAAGFEPAENFPAPPGTPTSTRTLTPP